MNKKYALTERKIAARMKAGRGQGSGAQYVPWLLYKDFPSRGRVSRILGRKNARVHHFFSDNEVRVFQELDWREDVLDIREQMPLDRRLTRIIASDMGVRHPRDPSTQVDIIMTTDFLVDMTDPKSSMCAIAVKQASELENKRVLEKLEIERRYWVMRGVAFKIVTEQQCSRVRSDNLAFLHEYHDADRWPCAKDGFWLERSALFLAMQKKADPTERFCSFAQRFEALGGYKRGEGVAVLRYLASRRQVAFDLEVRFTQDLPLAKFQKPATVGFKLAA